MIGDVDIDFGDVMRINERRWRYVRAQHFHNSDETYHHFIDISDEKEDHPLTAILTVDSFVGYATLGAIIEKHRFPRMG